MFESISSESTKPNGPQRRQRAEYRKVSGELLGAFELAFQESSTRARDSTRIGSDIGITVSEIQKEYRKLGHRGETSCLGYACQGHNGRLNLRNHSFSLATGQPFIFLFIHPVQVLSSGIRKKQ